MRAFPENQTFWRRVGAALIDGVLFVPLYWINATAWEHFAHPAIRVAWFVTYSIAFVSYSVSMHAIYGQTLGKMATRILILTTEATPITWRHALLRDAPVIGFVCLGIAVQWQLAADGTNPFSVAGVKQAGFLRYLIDKANECWLYLELITMWSNARRRAVHDFLAGTVVYRVKRVAEGT